MTDLKLGQSRERERESKGAPSKKTIKINACDFWTGFKPENNLLSSVLGDRYNFEISDEPDFLVYSCFGEEFKKYKNCVKIFYTGENVCANFNECDYGIGFDDIKFGDRYLRFNCCYRIVSSKRKVTKDLLKRKFCNFIYSNSNSGEGALLRQEFFYKLSEYRHIDAPGKVCHNMDAAELVPRDGDWILSKQNFLENYKFTIAFENSKSIGYTTEKLFDPLRAYSIPIYWGNPDIVKDVNPKSFINCNDYDDFEGVIKRVIELDNNDREYLKMLKERPIPRNSFLKHQYRKREKFLINIIEKGMKPFNKNPRNFKG